MGHFGFGWSLGLLSVARKTVGYPTFNNTQDVFVFNGAEDLVEVKSLKTEQSLETTYRPRTETNFSRIKHIASATQDFWEIRTRDGMVHLLGAPLLSDEAAPIVSDPAQPEHIFKWVLHSTEDPFGNRITYEYVHDRGTDASHKWHQLYLNRINYVDYEVAGEIRSLVSVAFEYEDRPDPFSSYRSGFDIRTTSRCSAIRIYTNPATEQLTRSYQITYLDQLAGQSDQLAPNAVSLIGRITSMGHDGDDFQSLPPIELQYSNFRPDRRTLFEVEAPNTIAAGLESGRWEFIDLFGKGLPDLIEFGEAGRYWKNLGNGKFDHGRELPHSFQGLSPRDPSVAIIDANGDGRLDFLISNNGSSGYFPLVFEGQEERLRFHRFDLSPMFVPGDPELRFVDVNADGVVDAIRAGVRLECFLNDPLEGWSSVRTENASLTDRYPSLSFADPRVKLADMSGDVSQDIVIIYDGNLEYFPALGSGKWGHCIQMRKSPRFPHGYDSRRVLLGDVDGDGLADLVYIGEDYVTVWINQCGNTWSDPITITGTPDVATENSVRLIDLLGNGIAGVLWIQPVQEKLFFLDLTGSVKPYLMISFRNNFGAQTLVEYTTSARCYLQDDQHRTSRWKTSLPIPIQVVSKLIVLDEISQNYLTTEFFYHHGSWDGVEQEFRGFARVDQRDTQSLSNHLSASQKIPNALVPSLAAKYYSPPVETRTWYHVGPVGEEFGEWEEIDLREEYWPGDPSVLKRPVQQTDFLAQLPRRTRRDAIRCLRGAVLRSEIYALDGSALAAFPYVVSESLTGIREVVTPAGMDEESLSAPVAEEMRVFFPHQLLHRSSDWQRGSDPRTSFTIIGGYDDYGQARSTIRIGVPRGRQYLENSAGGSTGPYLAFQELTDFSYRDDNRFIVDRVSRSREFAIPNQGEDDVFSFINKIEQGLFSSPENVRGFRLNFFDRDSSAANNGAFVGLPFGECGDFGHLVRTEQLVLTDSILNETYPAETGGLPPHLADEETAWTDEYPDAYRQLTATHAGYLRKEAGPNSPYLAGFYATKYQARFDFHETADGSGRGLLLATRDALGNEQTTAWDEFGLLPITVTNAVGLETHSTYDYARFQPIETTDANLNKCIYGYTPLGLLAWTSFLGKGNEGDSPDEPGVQFVYNFNSWQQPLPDQRTPISIRTIKRVHHALESDVPPDESDQVVETVEYSDGFGRLLQTRSLCERNLTGDPQFGDGILAVAPDPQADATTVLFETNSAEEPNVLVSGWRIYDNKGRAVESYDGFFSTGWEYASQNEAPLGQKTVNVYDAVGNLVRRINPDGSEQRHVLGTVADIAKPALYLPSTWEQYVYDENDNAGITHPAESVEYQHQHFTPLSKITDALGRIVEVTERHCPPGSQTVQEFKTRTVFDARGNVRAIFDALGRQVHAFAHDLLGSILKNESLDCGTRTSFFDANGRVVQTRESNGSLRLNAYDPLNRSSRIWARDRASGAVTLREHLTYGDAGTALQPAAERAQRQSDNLLNQLVRHFEEAGLLVFARYDFMGNVLEKTRRPFADGPLLNAMDQANGDGPGFTVDWTSADDNPSQLADSLLSANEYQTSITYDGLGRMKTMRYPEAVDGAVATLRPSYDEADKLSQLRLNDDVYVRHIAYNARGQRTLIAYGNGLLTRFAYDPETFRLVRMRTERYTLLDGSQLGFNLTSPAAPLQEIAHTYDCGGNVRSVVDRTPGGGVLNNPQAGLTTDSSLAQLLVSGNALIKLFEYDSLNRLVSASGRRCQNIAAPRPWFDAAHCGFKSSNHGTPNQDNAPQSTTVYDESYQYDPAGNLLRIKHTADAVSWTRAFGVGGADPDQWNQLWPIHLQADAEWVDPPGNRLTHALEGSQSSAPTHAYDECGNLIRETSSRFLSWDHKHQLRDFQIAPSGAPPSVQAVYMYDSYGARVRKVTRKQNGAVYSVVYIDGLFEHCTLTDAQTQTESSTIMIIDNATKVATVRFGPALPDDNSPAVLFYLGDHLGSAALTVGADGSWTNREEYSPFGETVFGSFAAKRYRFTGKQRDSESGFAYHGARYYAPWLGRWTSGDPLGAQAGLNAYCYVRNSPVNAVDSTGLQETPATVTQPPPREERSEPKVSFWGSLFPTHFTGALRPQLAPGLSQHPEWQRFQAQATQQATEGAAHVNLAVATAALGVGMGAQVGLVLASAAAGAARIGAAGVPRGALLSSKSATVGALTATLLTNPSARDVAMRTGSQLNTVADEARAIGSFGTVQRVTYMVSNVRFEPFARRLAAISDRLQKLIDANRWQNLRPYLSTGEQQFAARGDWAQRITYGKGFERCLAQSSEFLKLGIQHVGGANNPDFTVRLGGILVRIDATTLTGAARHLQRPYYANSSNIFVLYQFKLNPGQGGF